MLGCCSWGFWSRPDDISCELRCEKQTNICICFSVFVWVRVCRQSGGGVAVAHLWPPLCHLLLLKCHKCIQLLLFSSSQGASCCCWGFRVLLKGTPARHKRWSEPATLYGEYTPPLLHYCSIFPISSPLFLSFVSNPLLHSLGIFVSILLLLILSQYH